MIAWGCAVCVGATVGSAARIEGQVATTWSGGLEIGRASARVSGADSTLLVAPAFSTSTVLSADLARRGARTQLLWQGGLAMARTARGGYGRMVGVFLSDASAAGRSGWLLSADGTLVGATREGKATSAGVSGYYGRSDVVLAGLRVGQRWRGRAATPVTTLDLSHVSPFRTDALDGSLGVSFTATRTAFTGNRVRDVVDPSFVRTVSPYRATVTLADLHVTPRVHWRALTADVDAMTRLGRAASVWDDYTATFTTVPGNSGSDMSVQRERHGRFGGSARVGWEFARSLTLVGEGGRRLSDPMSGLAGSRYVSVSLRVAVDAARLRATRRRDASTAMDAGARRQTPSGARPGVSDTVAGVVVYQDGAADSTRAVMLRGVRGMRVEIAGDFTEWRPVALEPCDAAAVSDAPATLWCGRFPLRPGAHYFLVRADGGAWRVAPGATPVPDSYGETVGLLVVP